MYDLNSSLDDKRSCFTKFPKRYILTILGFLGFANFFALRVNLPIGLRGAQDSGVLDEISSEEKGRVLSAFFCGYILTQIPGGWIARRYGGKWPFAVGICGAAIAGIVTPIAMMTGPIETMATQFVSGLFEGLNFPAMHELFSRWAPVHERSKLACFTYSGTYFGAVMANFIGGYVTRELGWIYGFVIDSCLAFVWFVLWIALVHDKPRAHPSIQEEELNEIESSLGYNAGDYHWSRPIPWVHIVTSAPFWAILTAHVVQNWGFYTLLTQLPFYFKDVHEWTMETTGLLIAAPFLAMTFSIIIAGWAIDYLRDEKMTNTTILRKTAVCSAFTGVALLFISAVYSTTYGASLVCIVAALALSGVSAAGFLPNHIDIAPQFAGILMGLTNTAATVPGIVSPIVTGIIVKTGSSEEWQMVFYIAAIIYVFGAIVYGTFASSETQQWSLDNDHEDDYIEGRDSQIQDP